MAISSIHIATGASGYLAHNDRSKKTENSIFLENENEIWNMKKEAFEIFKSELTTRAAAYTKRTGQKLQKKANTHLSSIINLNKNHSIEDVKKVADYLESEFGTKVFQIAIHRDEGHITNENEKVVNYHAHLEFLGLDQDGQSVKRKFNRSALIKLQTKVSELLEMERGQNYSKTKSKRPKRLDTYEFKFHKEQEQKTKNETLAKVKDLTAENKKLQAELKALGAERDDHAKREKLVRDLKKELKEKNLTIDDLEKRMAELLSDFKRDDKDFTATRTGKPSKSKTDTSLREKKDIISSSFQEKVFFKHYQHSVRENLKGFYIDTSRTDGKVILSHKAKKIKIIDTGEKIIASGENKELEAQVKIMLDIAQAKEWNLLTLDIEGNDNFKKEVSKQVSELLKKNKPLEKIIAEETPKKDDSDFRATRMR